MLNIFVHATCLVMLLNPITRDVIAHHPSHSSLLSTLSIHHGHHHQQHYHHHDNSSCGHMIIILDFVLELAPGGELGSVIEKYGPLSLEAARFYMAELVNGLEFIHSKGILHRDLKVSEFGIGSG